MQSPAKAADWPESPLCLFLKGAACNEGETELAPQNKERSKQPGGAKPSQAQPVPHLAPLAHSAWKCSLLSSESCIPRVIPAGGEL